MSVWQYIEIDSVNDSIDRIDQNVFGYPTQDMLDDNAFFLDNNVPGLWTCLVFQTETAVTEVIVNNTPTTVYPLLGGYWHGNRPTPKNK